MNWIHAVILGIVEGISEFLPISSTGHLILTGQILGLEQTEFLKSFEIAIQAGAILSVIVLYWKRLLVDFETMKRVAAAFIPTAVLGLVLYKIVKKYLLAGDTVVVWSLLLGGIFMIVFERVFKEKETAVDDLAKIPYRTAALIGVFQAFAMVPGVSRSAATILGGMYLGLKRRTIVEFSFLLAVPTMLAATALDLLKSSHAFTGEEWSLLGIGAAVSFVVAIGAIKWLLGYVRSHGFTAFGIYRIVLAVVFLIWVR